MHRNSGSSAEEKIVHVPRRTNPAWIDSRLVMILMAEKIAVAIFYA
jgi:hypothetical protein